jgi:phenylacetate-CoA ligase
MTIWDPYHETIDRERLEVLQLERLQHVVARIHEHVPFCRRLPDGAGFEPGDVKSLDDLAALPFTEKTDFRDEYPTGLFAVPLDDVVEIHSSSGTTGKPVVCGFTAAGVRPDDVAQISFGYGMFTGGFGLHFGLPRAGASVIAISAGNTARQIQFLRDFGTTALIATPSDALYIGETLEKMGVPREDLKLRLGLFGAEACSEELRAQIERRLPMTATDNYGLTEIIGPGVAGECECRDGMHIAEDRFIVECLARPPAGRSGTARSVSSRTRRSRASARRC